MRRVFIDTNILVYAYDRSDLHKQQLAKELVAKAVNDPELVPVISYQVLCEFANVIFKILKDRDRAQKLTALYLDWECVALSTTIMVRSLELFQKYQLSIWDASIIAAAEDAAADEIWSEDFSHTQQYAGMRVVNPFAS